MKLRTRLLILASCALVFLAATPLLVFYALGYRFDFINHEIISTGGIYVKAIPTGAEISIDTQPSERTTYFNPSIFVQNLVHGNHSVSIKKDAYISYQKTLPVKDSEVTKLEEVILFKESPAFSLAKNNVDYFSLAPDQITLLTAIITKNTIEFEVGAQNNRPAKTYSLAAVHGKIASITWSNDSKKALVTLSGSYFLLDILADTLAITPLPALKQVRQVSFNPDNSTELFFIKDKNLYSSLAAAPLVKNIATYATTGNNLVVFSYDGFLYQTTLLGVTSTKLTNQAFTIQKTANYSLVVLDDMVFLKQGDSTFSLDRANNMFVPFFEQVQGLKLSPDQEKITFFTPHEIFYTILKEPVAGKISLGNVTATISEVHWFNNDYVIFTAEDSVIISEIDARGNVNVAPLPKTISVIDTTGTTLNIEIKNPTIFFSDRDKKVYLLTERTLVISEKLVP